MTGDLPPGAAPSLETGMEPAISVPLPDRIGQYNIKRIIGSGGMGTVYEAMQEQPRRVVAVKVMKKGLTSRSALRRFTYESQILARLRHPGIAQVFDAGVHDDGTGGVPYFAMEYIANAKTVRDFVKDRKLNGREILALFIKICEAVHHGHQKGIIHRDLKPDNILVDSSGQPKIIDFGVARATDSDLAVTTLQTSIGQLVGTLQYMSPEQIDADPHDMDTRADVYALGVVLYELLTGKLPYDVRGVSVMEATRVIRDVNPQRISAIDSTLKGDTETIVLHALEKDRDRRYQSALELAGDIERYLGNHPIIARPPSMLYYMRTFAKRNKAVVVGVAAVFLALVLGVVGMTLEADRAHDARDEAKAAKLRAESEADRAGRAEETARREADTANAAVEYVRKMFSSLNAREGSGPNTKVSEVLDDAARGIEDAFADEPEVQARLQSIFGNGYRALTLYPQAVQHLRESLALQRQTLGESHEEIAQTLEDLCGVLWFQRRLDEAVEAIEESLAMRRALFGDEHEEVASGMNYLAACLNSQGKPDEAERLYRETLAMRIRLLGEGDELVARSKNNLATCLRVRGKYDEAEQLYREALAIVRALRGADHIDVGRGLSSLATCLIAMEREIEAEGYLIEALHIKQSQLRDDHASIAITQHALADLYFSMGRYDEAVMLCREAIEIRKSKHEPTDGRIIASVSLLAKLLVATGEYAEAEDAAQEEVLLRRTARQDDSRIAAAEGLYGYAIAKQGRREKAETLLLGSYRQLRRDRGIEHQWTQEIVARLIELYELWNQPEEASTYRKLLAGDAAE